MRRLLLLRWVALGRVALRWVAARSWGSRESRLARVATLWWVSLVAILTLRRVSL